MDKSNQLIISSKIDNYVIDMECIKRKRGSCCHQIYIRGEWRNMCGFNIHRILSKEGVINDHFEQYKEYIRRKDNPTLIEKNQSKKAKERNREFKFLRNKLDDKKRELNEYLNNILKIKKQYLNDIMNIENEIKTLKRGYELSNNPRINKLKGKIKKW